VRLCLGDPRQGNVLSGLTRAKNARRAPMDGRTPVSPETADDRAELTTNVSARLKPAIAVKSLFGELPATRNAETHPPHSPGHRRRRFVEGPAVC